MARGIGSTEAGFDPGHCIFLYVLP
jgi:hypothetical protein